MSHLRLVVFGSVGALAILRATTLAAADTPSPAVETIAINDNRMAAGTLNGTTLSVHLETREGLWHPDGDRDPGANVLAFALEGGPLQIPGPLIRVTEGTEIRAFVRNQLEKDPLIIHGMYTRPAAATAPEPITIEPGQVREIRFLAGVPGTYYYWGATSNATLPLRAARDTQLYGGFLVEPRGRAAQDERVFLIGVW